MDLSRTSPLTFRFFQERQWAGRREQRSLATGLNAATVTNLLNVEKLMAERGFAAQSPPAVSCNIRVHRTRAGDLVNLKLVIISRKN